MPSNDETLCPIIECTLPGLTESRFDEIFANSVPHAESKTLAEVATPKTSPWYAAAETWISRFSPSCGMMLVKQVPEPARMLGDNSCLRVYITGTNLFQVRRDAAGSISVLRCEKYTRFLPPDGHTLSSTETQALAFRNPHAVELWSVEKGPEECERESCDAAMARMFPALDPTGPQHRTWTGYADCGDAFAYVYDHWTFWVIRVMACDGNSISVCSKAAKSKSN